MAANGGVVSEADALFIEGVRQTCILYNPSSADFRLSYKKEKAWEDLAANLGITPAEARRRWTCLRDRYTRELRQVRMKSPRKSVVDCGGSELFRRMDFLRPFVKKRVIHPNPWKAKESNMKNKLKMQGNTENDIQTYSGDTDDQYDNKLDSTSAEEEYNLVACEYPLENYDDYTTEQQSFTTEVSAVTGTQQKSVKSDIIPLMLSPMPASASMINSTTQQQHHQIKIDSKSSGTLPQQQENEDDFFCKSVAMYLRKLSRRHKIKAKVEMFQILEKYIEIEENAVATDHQHEQRH